MQIHISADGGTPIYQQIVNQVKYQVASGYLTAGEELPPIRVLAEQLLINPNTVARAYRELQNAGLVVKRGTTGSYIADTVAPAVADAQVKNLQQRIDALLTDVRQMGIGLEELKTLLEQRAQLMRQQATLEE